MRTRRLAARAARLRTGLCLLAVLSLLGGLAGCGSGGHGSADGGTVAAVGPATPAASSLDVVALGDSVVAGTACDCETFVQRYAKLVAGRTGARVQWRNDGVGGQTSSGLLTELRSPSTTNTSDDVGRADVVLITIGANDLTPALTAWQDDGCAATCMSQDLPQLGRNVAAIVARVHQLRGDRPVLIAVTDYWNVFEDGQVADRDFGRGFAAWSDRITRLANRTICSAAAAATTCVDLYGPFNGGDRDPTALLADDGDHPDAAGHQVIADTLAAAMMPAARAATDGS